MLVSYVVSNCFKEVLHILGVQLCDYFSQKSSNLYRRLYNQGIFVKRCSRDALRWLKSCRFEGELGRKLRNAPSATFVELRDALKAILNGISTLCCVFYFGGMAAAHTYSTLHTHRYTHTHTHTHISLCVSPFSSTVGLDLEEVN